MTASLSCPIVLDGSSCCQVSAVSVIAALKACSRLGDKNAGERIHSCLQPHLARDVYVTNTLLDMYAKCGSMQQARRLFDTLSSPGLVSWNCIMMGYVQNGEGKETLDLYDQMREKGCEPSRVTFLAVLKACSFLASQVENCLKKVRALHQDVIRFGLEDDVFVAARLVDAYAKCGGFMDARYVFEGVARPDGVLWVALVLGYLRNGEAETGLVTFSQMVASGYLPNGPVAIAAVKACASLAERKNPEICCLAKCRAIHLTITSSGLDTDVLVASTMVDMYVKCGSMKDASKVFERMPQLDIVCWNLLIRGYVQYGQSQAALELYSRLTLLATPNPITLMALLKACGSLAEQRESKGRYLEKGMAIHAQAGPFDSHLEMCLESTLVDMYAKCSSMPGALRVFDGMQRRDVVAWTAMIMGYAEAGHGQAALDVYSRMQKARCAANHVTLIAALKACVCLAEEEEPKMVEGKLVKLVSLNKGREIHLHAIRSGYENKSFLMNTLLDMYASCGSMAEAATVFDSIPRPTVVSWNCMISGYVQSGEGEMALQLYRSMQDKGFRPDRLTFVAALKACGCIGALENGRVIHEQVVAAGLHADPMIGCSLIDFYGKCGSMAEAEHVFESSATLRDLKTWDALMAGYSRQGNSNRVLELFEMLLQAELKPDVVIFTSVLAACGRSGNVEKGRAYFQAMWPRYRVSPGVEHYTCIIDMLGRANQLDEALRVLYIMPFKPNVQIWTSLLDCCCKWNNLNVGKLAFESIMKLDPENAGAYVLFSNLTRLTP